MKKTMTMKEMANHNTMRVLLATALLVAPMTTFAYTQTLSDLSILIIKYFNQAIYVIIALAILIFVWNIYHYFFKADPENKKDAGLYVMYSVIGFFVIIAFWGLVNIVSNTLNLNTNAPSLNFFNSSASTYGGSGTSASSPFTGGSNYPAVNPGQQYSAPIGPQNFTPSAPSPDQTTNQGDISS